ncbi:Vgb family protein [Nitrosopumilus sp. S6]
MHVKLIVYGISLTTIFFTTIFLILFEFETQSISNSNNQNQLDYSDFYIKEYSLPDGTFPNSIISNKEGFVFVTGSQIHSLFKFHPDQETFVSSFDIKNDMSQNESGNFPLMSWSMIEDQDGMIWFSQMGPNPIWMFNPITEKFTSFSAKASPFQLKADNNGNIWFTTITANTVGVIQKSVIDEGEYTISEFNLINDKIPSGIFLENNHIWISMIGNNQLVKFEIVYDDESNMNPMMSSNWTMNNPQMMNNMMDQMMNNPQAMQNMHDMMLNNPWHMQGMMGQMMGQMMDQMMDDPELRQQMMNNMMMNPQMMQNMMQNQQFMQSLNNP